MVPVDVNPAVVIDRLVVGPAVVTCWSVFISCAWLSTYPFVAASCAEVGLATLVILFISITKLLPKDVTPLTFKAPVTVPPVKGNLVPILTVLVSILFKLSVIWFCAFEDRELINWNSVLVTVPSAIFVASMADKPKAIVPLLVIGEPLSTWIPSEPLIATELTPLVAYWSTYAFVAASCAKVGLPTPVTLFVPIAITPDIVPPDSGK